MVPADLGVNISGACSPTMYEEYGFTSPPLAIAGKEMLDETLGVRPSPPPMLPSIPTPAPISDGSQDGIPPPAALNNAGLLKYPGPVDGDEPSGDPFDE